MQEKTKKRLIRILSLLVAAVILLSTVATLALQVAYAMI